MADQRDIALEDATAPARWLLKAGVSGVPLTQTNALARDVVRDAARRWPQWWNAELFGEPHREAELAVLETLHATLRHLRLLRRRGRRLFTTPRGRELLADPAALFDALLTDLRGADPFIETISSTLLEMLARAESVPYLELCQGPLTRIRREGWRDPAGVSPTEEEIGWAVADLLRRGEAFGVIEQRLGAKPPRGYPLHYALTAAARRLLAQNP